jgi:hypothetical protein
VMDQSGDETYLPDQRAGRATLAISGQRDPPGAERLSFQP